jgi:hypothetical protein
MKLSKLNYLYVLTLTLIAFAAASVARASDVPDNMLSDQLGTNRRPDFGMRFENSTNRDLVLRGDTYCADFPGTYVIPANTTRLIWAEGRHGGSCYVQSKRVEVKADGYAFQINGFAQWMNVSGFGTNLPWEINIKESAGMKVLGYEMSGLDRIVTIRIQ